MNDAPEQDRNRHAAAARIVLLGPQQSDPSVVSTLDRLEIAEPVGLITAGWKEWEGDETRIDPALAARAVHLELFTAAGRVWRADPDLEQAHKTLQRRIRVARRAYNVRLEYLMQALVGIRALDGDRVALGEEEELAFAAIRDLDLQQEQRVAALRAEYQDRLRPEEREAVRRERSRLESQFESLSTVVIEGGHVAVLLNRMRLLGVASLLGHKTVLACSGAAMVLSPKVVLFHDSPPQGRGHPELAEAGLAMFPDVVALPHADRRLLLHDPERVALFAQRFGPSRCVPLEPGAWIEWIPQRWTARGARQLTPEGTLEPWETAA